MQRAVGRYRIDRKLGEGGMGVVYAAVDERLGRAVALKMLRTAWPDPQGRKRLLREARAAAGVSHPNVCQIYDVGDEGGALYVAMELLEGETLAARLARGALPVDEACSVALAVLAALEALHRKDLVHRDLKPSNVFLTPHGVKLMDFGLARPLTPPSNMSTRLTAPGTILGTPHYMAPEQVRGDQTDERTDLYAAGALLAEMLTGRPPFAGPTVVDVMYAVLHSPPPAVEPSEADAIVQRALSKSPADRYGSAQAMAADLRAMSEGRRPAGGAGAVRPLRTRVIVLPFRLLRLDPEIEFLGVSLADAISTSLTGLGSLIVRSTLTASRFPPDAVDLAEIAREAEVDVVLTGTLLRMGAQVRVTSQLVELPGGAVLWSESSPIALDDVFALQEELARRIVASLKLPLTAREDRLLRRDVPSSARAYEQYLRATELALRPVTWKAARDLLEHCVAEDPGYAPAWARLGRVYRLLAKYDEEAGEVDYARAEAAFQRALAINPGLSLAHTGLAALEVELGRPIEAMVRLLEQARLASSDAPILAGLVHALRYCGLLDASVTAQHKARLLDPRIHTSVGYTYFMLGHYRRLIEDSDQPLDTLRSSAFALLGRPDEAFAALAEEEARASGVEVVLCALFRAAMEGGRAEAIEGYRTLRRSNFRDPEGLFHAAAELAFVGASAEAADALRDAVAGGFYCPTPLLGNAWLAPVRALPVFRDIIHAAIARHRRAVEAYAKAGGPALLGVPARTQSGPALSVGGEQAGDR
jgi:TolB-like protein